MVMGSFPAPFVRAAVRSDWYACCSCAAAINAPLAGLEPAIFGLEVRRLVH